MSRRLLLPLATLPLAALSLVAGCHAPAIDAPSLATRPVERQPIELPDAASEPATPVPPALAATLERERAAAQDAHRRFESEHASAQAIVRKAAGASEGSELWVQGQQGLSGLEAAQGPLRDVAAEVSALREDPANYGAASRSAIDAVATAIETLQAAEAKAIADLSAQR